MTTQVQEFAKSPGEDEEEELNYADFSRTYTVDEYMELIFPYDKQYELINGELVQINKGGPSYEHGKVFGNLFFYLSVYVREKALGEVLSNLAFALTYNTSPIPDVAFIAANRPPVAEPRQAFPGAPDLAVEILSRTDVAMKVDNKIETYLTNGVKLVWIVNPRRKSVEIFHAATGFKSQSLIGAEELDGEDIIPGFKIAVEKLFI